MMAAPVHLCGERLMLDPLGGLVWPAHRTLIVSDLHLEKGSSFARQGMLLPPWDTQATLDKLALLLRRYGPETVIALGDSFHDSAGASRLPVAEQTRLAGMTRAHRFVWIEGNHDPSPPQGLEGRCVAELAIGKLIFRHQAQPGPLRGEISGHFHPKAMIQTRASAVSRPCFVFDSHRLLLPAFGAYTGGLDITDDAIVRLFPRGGRAFLLGQERLYSFPFAARRPGQARAMPGA